MINLKIENDLNFNAIPRRQAERRTKTHPAYIEPQHQSSESKLPQIKGIVERRLEDRRKSRPAAFLSVEEIIRLRKR